MKSVFIVRLYGDQHWNQSFEIFMETNYCELQFKRLNYKHGNVENFVVVHKRHSR